MVKIFGCQHDNDYIHSVFTGSCMQYYFADNVYAPPQSVPRKQKCASASNEGALKTREWKTCMAPSSTGGKRGSRQLQGRIHRSSLLNTANIRPKAELASLKYIEHNISYALQRANKKFREAVRLTDQRGSFAFSCTQAQAVSHLLPTSIIDILVYYLFSIHQSLRYIISANSVR